MLNLCLKIGNICNGLLLGNASIAGELTWCKKTRKTLGFKKIMVYKIPTGGGGVGKPYLATGLLIRQSWAGNLESKISELAASQTLMKFNDYLKFHNWIDINGL